jgi:hypothetical protein
LKKTSGRKMGLHRETLRQLEELGGREMKVPAGGFWPVTTVHPYPCQPSCLCT